MTSLRYVALLRGINVGTAKRLAMADLRSLMIELGYSGVRTHLNSGNVVFDTPEAVDAAAVAILEHQLLLATSVTARVLVLSAEDFRRIAEENPLADSPDPSRMVITFVQHMPQQSSIRRPSVDELAPEVLSIGTHAIYQWCPNGILASAVPASFLRQFGTLTTTRNLRTVTKLVSMLDE